MPNIYTTDAGLPYVVNGGDEIVLGCLPPDPLFSAIPDFKTAFEAIPESKWFDNSLKYDKLQVRNQGTHGSCAGQGTVNCFTIAKKRNESSTEIPSFSATFIYGHINGNRDAGARIGDAMKAIIDYGTCFNSQVPDNVIYKSQFPPEAFQTSKRFKALEAYKIKSFEELCTALTMGIPCVSGIAVGNNFVRGDLDSNGIAPLPDVIVGGHALCHVGIKRLNGNWLIETLNSWGSGWGNRGYCYLKKEHWSPGYGFPFDCFAIYSIIDDPLDVNDNPPNFSISLDNEEEDEYHG